MIRQVLLNITAIIICYVNTAYSSEYLIEQQPLITHAIQTPLNNSWHDLCPDIILLICKRPPLQDIKHLSELNQHYSKAIRHQILIMKAAQRLNNGIAIERNPSNLQLNFIKAIVTGNFKFEIHYSRKSDYVNYGIKDNGDMITLGDYETPPYDVVYSRKHFDKITGTVKGFNHRHLLGKIHATEKKDNLGLFQAHIKTDEEEKFLECADEVLESVPAMVSADGNTIVGRMSVRKIYYRNDCEYFHDMALAFKCTNQKDMKQLSSENPYRNDWVLSESCASCVSGDGKIIGGLIGQKPAVWIDDNPPFVLEDFLKAPKSMKQDLTLTRICQISQQGTSWFGYGYYTAKNKATRELHWIIKFDFDKTVITNAEKSVAVSKKRKRVKIGQN